MKKISRKGFLKIAAAAAMSGVTAGALSACNSSSSSAAASTAASGASVYTAGTYTATAKGMNDVTVTMTFSETAITEVKVDTANETLELAVNSAEDFQTMLMDAQSAEIDGVSGATVTSNAVKEAAANCIQQAIGLTGGDVADNSADYGDDPRGEARAAAKADGRVFGYSGPGDWLGEAPAFDSVDSEVDCDVCVVGLGHAGVAAVLGAAEKGAKVVGIESQTQDNFAWYGEDIGAWNSQFAQDAGIPAWDLGQITDEFVTRSGGRADPGIVSLYVQHSGETLDHMLDVCKEMGVDERVYTYDNTEDGWTIIHLNADYDKIAAGNNIYDCLDKTNYPRKPGTRTWPATIQFMGPYSAEPVDGVAANSVLKYVQQAQLDKAVQDYGAELYYGTAAQVLVQNDNGDVVGVIAKDADGKIVKYNTKMGVVMCGGDYAGNADMCWALMNEYMERNEREGGLKKDFFSFMGGRDGSSLKMMCWAGGMIEPAPRGTMILGGGINSTPWGANSMLWLNSDGKRFCNEGNVTVLSGPDRRHGGSALLQRGAVHPQLLRGRAHDVQDLQVRYPGRTGQGNGRARRQDGHLYGKHRGVQRHVRCRQGRQVRQGCQRPDPHPRGSLLRLRTDPGQPQRKPQHGDHERHDDRPEPERSGRGLCSHQGPVRRRQQPGRPLRHRLQHPLRRQLHRYGCHPRPSGWSVLRGQRLIFLLE